MTKFFITSAAMILTIGMAILIAAVLALPTWLAYHLLQAWAFPTLPSVGYLGAFAITMGLSVLRMGVRKVGK